jgi:hypothetical protein
MPDLRGDPDDISAVRIQLTPHWQQPALQHSLAGPTAADWDLTNGDAAPPDRALDLTSPAEGMGIGE